MAILKDSYINGDLSINGTINGETVPNYYHHLVHCTINNMPNFDLQFITRTSTSISTAALIFSNYDHFIGGKYYMSGAIGYITLTSSTMYYHYANTGGTISRGSNSLSSATITDTVTQIR